MEEQVLEVVPVRWKKGLFKQEPWAIIITPGKACICKVDSGSLCKRGKEKARRVKKSWWQQVKQFFYGMGAVLPTTISTLKWLRMKR